MHIFSMYLVMIMYFLWVIIGVSRENEISMLFSRYCFRTNPHFPGLVQLDIILWPSQIKYNLVSCSKTEKMSLISPLFNSMFQPASLIPIQRSSQDIIAWKNSREDSDLCKIKLRNDLDTSLHFRFFLISRNLLSKFGEHLTGDPSLALIQVHIPSKNIQKFTTSSDVPNQSTSSSNVKVVLSVWNIFGIMLLSEHSVTPDADVVAIAIPDSLGSTDSLNDFLWSLSNHFKSPPTYQTVSHKAEYCF